MQHPEAKEWEKVIARPLFQLYRNTSEKSLWQVRLKGSGGYLRRRFNAPSVEKALELAPGVAGIGAPPEERREGMTLLEAFTEALGSANRRDKSRKDWFCATEKFLLWLKKRHPLCTHWTKLTRQILRAYLKEEFGGKAANTKRLRLQPILQTAGYMSREYQCPNVGERLGIGGKLKTTPATVYLVDVVSFCDFLKEREPHLEIGACLQGLAGLQLQEALRLTWDKVDLENGLVEISGEVKNEYRNRVIPVSARVHDALRRADERRKASAKKVQSVMEFVVVGDRGCGYGDFCSYSRQMRKAMKLWNANMAWCPKDLRNCLPTFAKMEGIHGTIWEQYIGHAPDTVSDRHYVPRLAARSNGETAAFGKQMDVFRRLVIRPVEEASAPAKICNFLQLSGTVEQQQESTGFVNPVESEREVEEEWSYQTGSNR